VLLIPLLPLLGVSTQGTSELEAIGLQVEVEAAHPGLISGSRI
jgi:hypothetical protein